MTNVIAQVDTLRAMAYNVLYYGDTPPCQAPHSTLHGYLRTIVGYANPDVIGLEKLAAIPAYPGDNSGTAPAGFGDSILRFALNAAYPSRYAACPFTNASGADNISMLFYDQSKLGFSSIISSYANITDFNTYKLYYKAADLASTHDTVFLYVTLNHTNSGSGTSDASIRQDQIDGYMAQLATHFTTLPNMINMGDFNTHNSSEDCYQDLVAPTNAAFRFYDPPFYEGIFTYPADWDNNPSSYAAYLTTSTRLSGSVPNSCGTSGGAKSWYDHMFMSAPIINGTAGIAYVPHSYRSIGNDGDRVGISVNDAPTNTAAPDSVIEAEFQFSNKYPIFARLVVGLPVGVTDVSNESGIHVENPVANNLNLHFNKVATTPLVITCTDMAGKTLLHQLIPAGADNVQVPFIAPKGAYLLQVTGQQVNYHSIITKL